MAFKKIPLAKRVKAVKKIFQPSNFSQIAQEFGISEDTLRNDSKKVLAALPTILSSKFFLRRLVRLFFSPW